MQIEETTSKTWTGPWIRTLKKLDLENLKKPGPLKAWILKNME